MSEGAKSFLCSAHAFFAHPRSRTHQSIVFRFLEELQEKRSDKERRPLFLLSQPGRQIAIPISYLCRKRKRRKIDSKVLILLKDLSLPLRTRQGQKLDVVCVHPGIKVELECSEDTVPSQSIDMCPREYANVFKAG